MKKIKMFLFQIRYFMQDVQDYLVRCESGQMEMINESITKSQVHIGRTRSHFVRDKQHLIKENALDFSLLGASDTARLNINNSGHYESLRRIEVECGTFQHLDKTQVKIEESYDAGT